MDIEKFITRLREYSEFPYYLKLQIEFDSFGVKVNWDYCRGIMKGAWYRDIGSIDVDLSQHLLDMLERTVHYIDTYIDNPENTRFIKYKKHGIKIDDYVRIGCGKEDYDEFYYPDDEKLALNKRNNYPRDIKTTLSEWTRLQMSTVDK